MFKLVVLLILVTICHGWESALHKASASIAAHLLSRKAAKFVKDHISMEFPRTRMTRIDYLMVKSASWADSIVSDLPWSADLHFAHTPERNCEDPFELSTHCPNNRCIVTAIRNYTERAEDPSLSVHERGEAIKFLIHLMADIHSPVHLGFAKDFGGNRLGVRFQSVNTNLHQVWDSFLFDSLGKTYKEIASLVTNNHVVEFRIDDQIVANKDRFARFIASETITQHTCVNAYSQNGDYIIAGDVLGEQYIQTRSQIVITQLIKSGIRLAQLLESIAQSFLEKQLESVPALPITESADHNMFRGLLFQFDPEEVLFELQDAFAPIEANADTDSEEPDTGEDAKKYFASTTTGVPDLTPEEKQRLRNKKERERKARNKRKIEGVDVPLLVVIKRGVSYFITTKDRVEDDEWSPQYFHFVHFKFLSASGDPVPRLFLLDAEVFLGHEWSLNLMNAVFTQLGAKKATGNVPEGLVQVQSFQRYDCKGIPGDLLSSNMVAVAKNQGVSFNYIPLSTVESIIFKRPSDEWFSERYGSAVDRADELFAVEYLRNIQDDLVLYSGRSEIIFVSRFDLLDRNRDDPRIIVSWVHSGLTMRSDQSEFAQNGKAPIVLFDVRVFDGALGAALGVVFEALRRFKVQQNVRRLLNGRRPRIFDGIDALERAILGEGEQVSSVFEAINRVDRGDFFFKTDELVLKPRRASRK
jgi:hypothetical protein